MNQEVLKRVAESVGPVLYLRALANLCRAGFMNKSTKYKYERAMRKALGMSYEELLVAKSRSYRV